MAVIHDPDVGKDRTWLESPCTMQSPPMNSMNAITSSPRQSIATLKKYQCPMCFLDRNLVEFGRKSDFKKHLNNFHGTDVTWICRTRSCHLSFATERAYSTHAKETHKMEALPSSAARTELCPQLVFACGFPQCKDRVFEASNGNEAANSRDKYFEHIAKHFEDEWDVNEWEYRVQMHNLMRQSRVKPVWKTCIWPKERRTQLSWKPRSSGDLRRMLEARHLGEDISHLVRLAFVLGNAPFTSSRTPPPSEIDLQFALPFRSQCLLETDSPTKSDDSTPTITVSKSRPQSLFRLPSRKGRRSTRPSTPASTTAPDTPMVGSDATAGPHPGTPIPIPHESHVPADAPRFAPEPVQLPRQANTPTGTPIGTPVNDSPMYSMPMEDHHDHGYAMFPPAPTSMPTNGMSPYEQPMQHDYDGDMMYGCTPTTTASTVRPATPVPHKRPASWSRVTSMEEMRPKKKPATPHGSPYDSPMSYTHEPPQPMGMPVTMDQIPNAYGEMIPPHVHHAHHQHAPTSMPGGEWTLSVREPQGGSWHQQQQHHHHHPQAVHYHHQQPQHHEGQGMENMTTFFFDDSERM